MNPIISIIFNHSGNMFPYEDNQHSRKRLPSCVVHSTWPTRSWSCSRSGRCCPGRHRSHQGLSFLYRDHCMLCKIWHVQGMALWEDGTEKKAALNSSPICRIRWNYFEENLKTKNPPAKMKPFQVNKRQPKANNSQFQPYWELAVFSTTNGVQELLLNFFGIVVKLNAININFIR